MGVIETQHPSRTRSCATLLARHVDGGAVWTLELSGEADIATLPLLKLELAEGVGVNRPRFVIDMAGLRFCDVRSAEMIMSVARNPAVILTGAAGTVKRVFDLLHSVGYLSRPVSSSPVNGSPRTRGSQRRMVRGPPGGA